MSCFYPLTALQLPGGELLFEKRTPGIQNWRLPPNNHIGRTLKLPCGRCIGCRVQRAQDWATRCLHESQLHLHNSFATCTINDESAALAAPRGSLSRRTHQLFMKRLRRRTSSEMRFYMCGEYGEKLKRPHYHYLLFGYRPHDTIYSHTSESGEKLYTSAELTEIWGHGKVWIGDVTYESCAYVAAYVMKKMNGELADTHYLRTDEAGNDYWLQPEFNEMSRRPGIARSWWERFNQDILVDDTVIRNGGSKMRPPRYYDKLLELMDPTAMAVLKLKREHRAKELEADNTPQRLADKEAVTKAKMAIKQRQLEKT